MSRERKKQTQINQGNKNKQKSLSVFRINNKNINMHKFLYYILTVLFDSNKINLLNK